MIISGWSPCSANCSQSAFTYTYGEQWSLSHTGELAEYSPGGYQVLLEQEQRKAVHVVDELEDVGWVDDLTRAVVVEFAVFNPNTRLFTQACGFPLAVNYYFG